MEERNFFGENEFQDNFAYLIPNESKGLFLEVNQKGIACHLNIHLVAALLLGQALSENKMLVCYYGWY